MNYGVRPRSPLLRDGEIRGAQAQPLRSGVLQAKNAIWSLLLQAQRELEPRPLTHGQVGPVFLARAGLRGPMLSPGSGYRPLLPNIYEGIDGPSMG